jgi:hypothetical protein
MSKEPTYKEIVAADAVLHLHNDFLESIAKMTESHGDDPEIMALICAAQLMTASEMEKLSKTKYRTLLRNSLDEILEIEKNKKDE